MTRFRSPVYAITAVANAPAAGPQQPVDVTTPDVASAGVRPTWPDAEEGHDGRRHQPSAA
jgi:hypothetical protein